MLFHNFRRIQCQNYYIFIQRYRCHANISASPVTSFKTRVSRATSSLQTRPQQLIHKRISADNICRSVRILYSFIGTKMVTVYVKLGSLSDARHVFDEIPERNLVSWTAMIGGYARYGSGEEALELFYRMKRLGLKPNEITFASILPACSKLGALERGV
ncbi:hypothetical protein SUGI_0180720 [Cryptomeria japonica]|nr:hypothetical protein SUGI_0180720 [Cryptomeria japonica]